MTEVPLRYDAGPMPLNQAWRGIAITIAATAVAMLVDRTVFEFINAPTVYDKDLGRLLRIMGFAGTWLALALAVGLQHSGDGEARATARRRGWLLFWSPMAAGALAEVLKIVVRRERPALNDGAYGFREWSERTLSGAGLAFPSSHTAVAFGGAFMLGRLFPRARWIGYVLAAGCGITRVLARAHFVSDVVFAAGLGWFVSWLLWRKWAPRAALFVLVASLVAPQRVHAQAPVPTCEVYEQCALGLTAKLTGISVVQGAEEKRLATLGFFVPGGRFDHVFAGDSTAIRIGRMALRERRIGATLTVGAAVTLIAATYLAIVGEIDESTAGGVGLGGLALGAAAVHYQFKADNSLSRAVWTFNRRFAR